jgi:hypothetical protein
MAHRALASRAPPARIVWPTPILSRVCSVIYARLARHRNPHARLVSIAPLLLSMSRVPPARTALRPALLLPSARPARIVRRLVHQPPCYAMQGNACLILFVFCGIHLDLNCVFQLVLSHHRHQHRSDFAMSGWSILPARSLTTHLVYCRVRSFLN